MQHVRLFGHTQELTGVQETSIRNSVPDVKRGGLAPGFPATSFLLDAYHAAEDGSAVDLRSRRGLRQAQARRVLASPDNFASSQRALIDSVEKQLTGCRNENRMPRNQKFFEKCWLR